MPYTSTDLATRALGFLQLRQAGQVASPEDLEAVLEFVDPLIEQLGIGGVAYVGDSDNIEGSFFLPLAKRLALEVAAEFGLQLPDIGTVQDLEATIRALTAKKSSGFPVKIAYF
jgi:hypothetical protein